MNQSLNASYVSLASTYIPSCPSSFLPLLPASLPITGLPDQMSDGMSEDLPWQIKYQTKISILCIYVYICIPDKM